MVQGSNPGPVLRVSKGHLGVELLLFRAGLGVSPLSVYTDHMPGQSSPWRLLHVLAGHVACHSVALPVPSRAPPGNAGDPRAPGLVQGEWRLLREAEGLLLRRLSPAAVEFSGHHGGTCPFQRSSGSCRPSPDTATAVDAIVGAAAVEAGATTVTCDCRSACDCYFSSCWGFDVPAAMLVLAQVVVVAAIAVVAA